MLVTQPWSSPTFPPSPSRSFPDSSRNFWLCLTESVSALDAEAGDEWLIKFPRAFAQLFTAHMSHNDLGQKTEFKIIMKYQILRQWTILPAADPTCCPVPQCRVLLKGDESSVLTHCSLLLEEKSIFLLRIMNGLSQIVARWSQSAVVYTKAWGSRSVRPPDPTVVCRKIINLQGQDD